MKTINLYLRRLKMDGIVKDMVIHGALTSATFCVKVLMALYWIWSKDNTIQKKKELK